MHHQLRKMEYWFLLSGVVAQEGISNTASSSLNYRNRVDTSPAYPSNIGMLLILPAFFLQLLQDPNALVFRKEKPIRFRNCSELKCWLQIYPFGRIPEDSRMCSQLKLRDIPDRFDIPLRHIMVRFRQVNRNFEGQENSYRERF